MSSGDQHQEIRSAAETIYHNVQQTSPFVRRHEISRSHHAHLDLIHFMNEDYIAGYMQDGQMSTVRRFFCLFVTFDVFFISLLWFICIMLNGDTITNALKVQVLNYTIQSSLFDIIFVAFIRFIFLLLFYGILYGNHWSVIAFTTTASCAFLIGKVFYYNWTISAQPIIQVLMIIVSCLLAWGEAWFLDCRVIPQEKNAQRFYRLIMSQGSERSPLLDTYLNINCSLGPTDSSVANFYSPIESAHNSDSEDDQDELWKHKGIADVRAACELLEYNDWKLEKLVALTGDRIQSIQRKKFGKIYRLTGQMSLPARRLMEMLYYGIESMPSWNPTLMESKILKKVDAHTDITYQLSAPGGGGLVDSREFINLRCWQIIENGSLIAGPVLNCATDIPKPLKLSKSTIELNKEGMKTDMNTSTLSLSKSLGAKILSENVAQSSSDQSTKTICDDIDIFVDANETTHDDIDINEKPKTDRMYVVSGASIKYDDFPCNSSYTRGENLIGCWAMRESTSDPNTCIFEWLMCLDLKARFPRFVLDKAYIGAMQEFMAHLRKFSQSET